MYKPEIEPGLSRGETWVLTVTPPDLLETVAKICFIEFCRKVLFHKCLKTSKCKTAYVCVCLCLRCFKELLIHNHIPSSRRLCMPAQSVCFWTIDFCFIFMVLWHPFLICNTCVHRLHPCLPYLKEDVALPHVKYIHIPLHVPEPGTKQVVT